MQKGLRDDGMMRAQVSWCPTMGIHWLPPPCLCTTGQFLFISRNVKEQVNCMCHDSFYAILDLVELI